MQTPEYMLHCSLNNKEMCSSLLEKIGIQYIINSKNNGLVSNLLEYYIRYDNNMIAPLIQNLMKVERFSLMKRDYLKLANYYYNDNYSMAESIFMNNILSKVNFNSDFILSSKDIDYMIENRMYRMLEKLENIHITSNMNMNIVTPQNLKLVDMSQNIRDSIILKIESMIPNHKYFLEKNFGMENFKTIIDGGSVIHNRGGVIRNTSIMDLVNITNMCENPVVVIHERHKKTIKMLEHTFIQNNINYYFTPTHFNDDVFILWFFLKNVGSYIVSNDKYRDHIFTFETKGKNTNSQFNHILSQQTLEFNCIKMWLQDKPKYSKCIQKINNMLYVPHVSGKFIEINL
jgi:hypothetical protein